MILAGIIAGLALGAVSSFHCIGMCGPIAFSLPVHFLPRHKKITGILLYNTGRVLVYAFLGLIFGWLGRQVYLGGWQQKFSIVMGLGLLALLVLALLGKRSPLDRGYGKVFYGLQQLIGKYLQRPGYGSLLLIGMANGFLPCGTVYLAVTAAMALGTATQGAVFMAVYGAGTLPAMFALSFFGSLVSMQTRNSMKKAIPFVWGVMGVLLILRGLNLNIPYISPYLSSIGNNPVSCH
jgi:sulfite exporter TauE/SafE